MPKNKPHKGLLKRVRLTKNGQIKMHRAYGRHLRSHKTASLIRKYRQAKYACPADLPRLRSLLQMGLPKVAKPAATEPAAADARA